MHVIIAISIPYLQLEMGVLDYSKNGKVKEKRFCYIVDMRENAYKNEMEAITMSKQLKKREITGALLIRWTGISAILAGILYIVIQLIHPADELTSVTTSRWLLVSCMTMAMSILSLLGLAGMYIRQVRELGWLGLIGYIIFSLFWIISISFSFVEAIVLPQLTADAPQYVEGVVGIFGGAVSEAELGFLPALAPIAGVMYALGGLLFGIAMFRAAVLPRLASCLLAFGAVVTFAAAVIPHPLDRMLAVPMGVALVALGYALWSSASKFLR